MLALCHYKPSGNAKQLCQICLPVTGFTAKEVHFQGFDSGLTPAKIPCL
jgi:hypothetical protein